MSRSEPSSSTFLRPVAERSNQPLLRDTIEKMAVRGPKGVNVEALPFSLHDTTAGNETELQALVIGNKQCVDLPIIIAQSNYFANIIRRSAAGDLTNRAVNELEQFINGNAEEVWENSWVRFPRKYLGVLANQILEGDLLADKADPGCGKRTDAERFLYRDNGHDFLRIPISYLLKLALADSATWLSRSWSIFYPFLWGPTVLLLIVLILLTFTRKVPWGSCPTNLILRTCEEHIREAWQFFAEDIERLEKGCVPDGEMYRDALQAIMRGQGVVDFIALQKQDILEERAPVDVIVKLLHLMILTIHVDCAMANLHPAKCAPHLLPARKQINI